MALTEGSKGKPIKIEDLWNLVNNSIQTSTITGNLTGNVNAEGTSNSVYGCKFKSELIFDSAVDAGGTGTLKHSIFDYEIIIVYPFLSYWWTPFIFTKGTLTDVWIGSYICFYCWNNGQTIVDFRFPSATQIKNNCSSEIRFKVYGIK